MKYRLTITAWYLNPDRIYQLINSKGLLEHLKTLSGHVGRANVYTPEGMARSIIKQELEEWLHNNAIPSLGELIAKNVELRKGQLFSIYQNFYGKGLSKYNNPEKPIPRDAIAELHKKIDYKENTRIRILYSPNNLISSSSWNRLSGQTRLFCLCYIDDVKAGEIIARPYVIGDLHTGIELQTPDSWDGRQYGEIHPSEIDQFSRVRDIYNSEKSVPDIQALKGIAEESIKTAFSEIIKEGDVPKDWGGEKSDLFSSNISIDGKYMSSAFLFKGPARFNPMKMTHLGKNGDQIDRLFSEPADLLILQHCHSVTTPVRSTMRAFASRVHDLRYFSIIDGYDTHRILSAYGKCGL